MTNPIVENPDTFDSIQISCRLRKKRKIVLTLIGICVAAMLFYISPTIYSILRLSDSFEIVLLLVYTFIFVIVLITLIGTMISKQKFKKTGWDQISVAFIHSSHIIRRYGKTYTIELLFENGNTDAKTIIIGDILKNTLTIVGENKELLKLCDFGDDQTCLPVGRTKVMVEVAAKKGVDIADIHLFNSGMRPVSADINGEEDREDDTPVIKDHKLAAKTHSMGRLWTVFIVLVIVGLVFLQYKLNIFGL